MTDTLAGPDLAERVDRAADLGMAHAVWAELRPDAVAIHESGGRTQTWGGLNAGGNRIARLLRQAGLKSGDAVALVCSNRFEFCEVLSGVLRVGMRLTPVNWHMTAEEIAYVVNDCEAKALFLDTRVAGAGEIAGQCPSLALKVAIGGDLEGFLAYDEVLAPIDGSDIADPERGYTMLYTSGTTGRPKGVYKPHAAYGGFLDTYDRETDLHICTGPAYHAAPLAGDVRRALVNGVPTLLLDKWDSELVLRLIQDRRVTHGHFVAIMFQRLLALPAEVRARYDVSSMKQITHGAAPCPPEVKHAMIEWFGPILKEYYAGSEGGVGFLIDSHEWLKKPGSVGKLPRPGAARIVDEEGNEVPRGQSGAIYMRLADQGGFEYYKDAKKTEGARQGGYFTMGDMGYFDEDDYLFLTGRSAETIIAGGVNIYPQEVDNELIKHPAVEDSATVGIPHDEYGEEVRAVIQLKRGIEPTEALKAELLDFARERLARYKVPRGLDFAVDLPRSEAGKIQRHKVRAPYWAGRTRQI